MGATPHKHPLPYCLALALTLSGGGLQAQVILDGTMGPAGPLAGPNYQIRAEYGQQRGGNLFQSFGVFNVNTGQSATFSGPNSVQNIIGRVTWGYPSTIDGALRSTIPGANLLLLNPAGVMFGPNATLNISGSFYVTTADYLRFQDGTLFDAHAVRPLLSVAPVEAFGFLSPNPAPILVAEGANLTVRTGKTLSVIGGDVAVGGALRAPSGRLDIAAMSGPGEVKPTATDLQTPSGQTQGTIDVAGGTLSVSGDNAGSIFIRGGRFSVDGGVVGLNARGAGDGGRLDVGVQDMEVTNDGAIGSLSAQGRGADINLTVDRLTLSDGGYIEVSSGGTGQGGNLNITASEAVTIKGYGQYASGLYGYAYSSGDAGQLRVSAPAVTVADDGVIQSLSGTGRGADITLAVDRLTLSDGGYIEASSDGTGAGGNLNITATEAVMIQGRGQYASGLYGYAYGSGDAGQLRVSAPAVTVADYGLIQSWGNAGRGADVALVVDRLTLNNGGMNAITVGAGAGGNITVTAREAVSIAGPYSSLASVVRPTAAGNGGDITVTAPVVELTNGGFIATTTAGRGAGGTVTLQVDRLAISGGGGVAAGTVGPGQGGDIVVNARDSVSLAGRGASLMASSGSAGNVQVTTATGAGGDITVTAPRVEIADGAFIASETLGPGAAGDVALRVDRLALSGGGFISTRAFGSGNGGDIAITAREAVSIGSHSMVAANTGIAQTLLPDATGDAGDITVTAPVVEVEGLISALTGGRGDAGAITLRVDRLTLSNGGSINTSTLGAGTGGDITVTAAESVSIAGAGASLESEVGPAASGDGGDITVTAPQVELNDRAFISSSTLNAGDAGAVRVQADRLALSGGSYIATDTYGAGQGGNITVTAPRVDLRTEGAISSSTTGAGDAGAVRLQVDQLALSGGGSISVITAGSGRGGNIEISADDTITISGGRSGIRADSGSTGDAGNITVTAPQVALSNQGAISSSTTGAGDAGAVRLQVDRLSLNSRSYIATDTYGAGRGGNITINAQGTVSISSPETGLSAATEGAGDAGTITLEVGRLELSEGGVIFTDTFGEGDGGDINVAARESISASSSLGEGYGSGLFASVVNPRTGVPATGAGGEITVTAPVIELGRGGFIESATYGAGDAGVIELNVDRLVVNSGGVSTSTEGAGRGGDIRVNASESVALSGGRAYPGAPSGLQASSDGVDSGDAGGITVTAPSISVSQGSQISSATRGRGNAGAVRLQVDRLTLSGGGSISVSTTGSGRGGNIEVRADEAITISDRYSGIRADTTSTGRGGNIMVTAPQVDLSNQGAISSSTTGAGDAGVIELNVDRLVVNSGGVSTSTEGAGRGGDIRVNASESVALSGGRAYPGAPFGLQASSDKPDSGDAGGITVTAPSISVSQGSQISSATRGRGNAGAITLRADRLTLSAGGEITTSTGAASSGSQTVSAGTPPAGYGGTISIAARDIALNNGRITSDTFGAGDAGNINLQGDRLTLTNGGLISTSTQGSGRGGNIQITAADTVSLSGANGSRPSGIYARSLAPATGDAGDITLTTGRLTLQEGVVISAESDQASGGNIAVSARDIELRDNSTISSSVQGAEGSDGGNVTLNGERLIVWQGGRITARANQGQGGRITVNTDVFLHEAPRTIPDVLDASSRVEGNQGVVQITGQVLDLSGALTTLPANYLDASALLSNRCTAAAGARSTFVARGRGALPPGPGEPAPTTARDCLPATPAQIQ